ncbi:hypothetical protein CC2G_000414 [Coprinopsis cinerea AmutBmut pab1-1]|nr:hypothetical protein CC2G_000414 [Coprinopsis cinerea AmutBmut pab1-1]
MIPAVADILKIAAPMRQALEQIKSCSLHPPWWCIPAWLVHIWVWRPAMGQTRKIFFHNRAPSTSPDSNPMHVENENGRYLLQSGSTESDMFFNLHGKKKKGMSAALSSRRWTVGPEANISRDVNLDFDASFANRNFTVSFVFDSTATNTNG